MPLSIAESLQSVRKQKGLTQEQLAQKIGVKRVTISRYENGTVEPGATALLRLCKALAVSADVLLGLNEFDMLEAQIPDGYFHLTAREQLLLERFRLLDEEQQEAVLYRALELRRFTDNSSSPVERAG